MENLILGKEYYEEVRIRAEKDVKDAKEKMNVIIEKELLELEINGIKSAIEDMKDSGTLTTKQELTMNSLINKLKD